MARLPKFIDVFHASRDRVPPHTVPHPYNWRNDADETVENAKKMEDEFDPDTGYNVHGRVFSQHVLFTGTPEQASDFIGPEGSGRKYVHHYRIPAEAIYPVTYGDDDDDRRDLPRRSAGDEPNLFTSVPLTRRSVVAAEQVIPMVNSKEGTRGESPISHVIPVHKVQDLDIKHMGVYSLDQIRNVVKAEVDAMDPDIHPFDMSPQQRKLTSMRPQEAWGEGIRLLAEQRHGRINDMVNLIRHPEPERPVENPDVRKNRRLRGDAPVEDPNQLRLF